LRRTRDHRSGLEDRVIADLEKRGIPYGYETKTFKFPRRVHRGLCGACGSKDVSVEREYTPDLEVGGFWVEIKGKLTGEIRSRMEDFLKAYPGIDLRFLFQRDNWITKKHKARYSDWCTKLGLKYYVGEEVPEEWIIPQT